MKRIVFAIFLFLFTIVAIGYAEVSESQITESDPYGAAYENSSSTTNEDSRYGTIQLPSSSSVSSKQLDKGEERGQIALIGDGLSVLVVCSLFFVIIKMFNERRKKQAENKNKRSGHFSVDSAQSAAHGV
ncbi:MAG: hypothetical protein FWF52_04545 [Candidatus Azobacteroides sp.]|nr:hypothetical protein [Candidatus Azobacteroides sp.]